jgi:zinc transport system ATP-binding protein
MLTSTVVDAQGVGVAIAGRPVLRRIDLTVQAGEFVALMGANGSGKSTLVRALVGLRALSAGSVRLFDVPLEKFRDRSRVGYVPQRAGAAGGVPASVREVVAAGRLTHRRPFRPLKRTDRKAIAEALSVVGLSDLARAGVSTLSGGQQQRVLIARALASQPDLLFLDEPTAGVDLPNQEALADSLRILSERGATVVLVAHELGPMAELVSRSVVMRDGRIAYDGDPLDDHEVHQAQFGDHPHAHHHPRPSDHDHAPHVVSPLDLADPELVARAEHRRFTDPPGGDP